jgi:hypothetical protein
MELRFSLSSEEYRPGPLVEQARRAEEAGFGFVVSRADLEGALGEDRP